MSIEAVIFDYKTLLMAPGSEEAFQARELIGWLKYQGLQWVLFSTDPLSKSQRDTLAAIGYPQWDGHIQQSDIPSGKRRGSPDWIDAVAGNLRVARNELLYVGSTALDWRTAINSGVLYLHARWAGRIPPGVTALAVQSPQEVREVIEIYLDGAPHWSYTLDCDNWHLRSLLPASAVLPSTSPYSTFRLQDVFTYDRTISIGDSDARDVLMLFALASAYVEGLIPANPFICVYPSSRSGRVSAQLEGYLDKAARLFHGYYRDDLLIRAIDAPDTSLARAEASRRGTRANVSISTQATTVHLGARYRGKLTGKTVIVFDDFTTKGMSLEWARLLLTQGGADQIVMLTIGKYGASHCRYDLAPGVTINPFALNAALTDVDFIQTSARPAANLSVTADLKDLVEACIANDSA